MVVSVVRTWFRCVNCSFVWRGTLLSLAFASVPLGSSFRDEEASIPLQVPAPGAIPVDELTPAGDHPDSAASGGRRRQVQPPAPGPHGEAGQASAAPQQIGAAGGPRDVESWLDTVEEDATPAGARPETAPPTDAIQGVDDLELEPSPPGRSVELGGWLEQVDEELPAVAAPADRSPRPAREESAVPGTGTGPQAPAAPTAGGRDEFGEWMTIEELAAIPPPAMEQDAPGAASATTQPAAGDPSAPSAPLAATGSPEASLQPPDTSTVPGPAGLSHLDELLKDLAVLQEGLTEMEQRLEGAEPSDTKVVGERVPADTGSQKPPVGTPPARRRRDKG